MRVTLNCTCGDVNVNLHTIETFISVCTIVKSHLQTSLLLHMFVLLVFTFCTALKSETCYERRTVLIGQRYLCFADVYNVLLS